MLTSFFSWWIARIVELLPSSWTSAAARAPDGIVFIVDAQHNLTALTRQGSRQDAVTMGIAARLAARKTVFLRPPPGSVLEKHHVVPTAPRRELDQLLRYELTRITPFTAEDLFWGWDGRPKPSNRSRTDVILTMIPKRALAPALDELAKMGVQPRMIETGTPERPRLLAIEHSPSSGHMLVHGMAWACATLAVVALLLPVLSQELALHSADRAIKELQPSIKQVQALRHNMTQQGAGQDVLAGEMQRTGDLLQVLAAVTRILPDDTYLTDFSFRDRQIAFSGRSAAAARLITSLSADPEIRDAAFAAPVTRIEGASTDVFSIRAGLAP